MKLNIKNGTGVETNAQTNSIDFGIGDPTVIIDILRNRLYGNPIRTLVQEYLCNGRDANREAGRSNIPLKVTIPTETDPVFKVRDFGNGISPERISQVFVLYGASTKRGTNSQTGGFGIGAKSAWAYTDSFTITTYIDGIARRYLAHIGTISTGSLDFLGESKTTEPNGTEIQIGVKQVDFFSFKTAVLRATFFWETRPEFDDFSKDEIPDWYKLKESMYSTGKCVYYKREQLGNFFKAKNWLNPSGIVLLIDDIPYPIETNSLISITKPLSSMFKEDLVLTVSVKNGDVEVSATRESIADSDFTKQKLKEITKKAIKEITNHNQKSLNNPKTLKELINNFTNYYNVFKHKNPIHFNSEENNYTIDSSGFIKNNSLKNINTQVAFVFGDSKRFKVEDLTDFGFNIVNSEFIYIDKIEGKITIREKIKTHLLNSSKKRAIIFSHDNYNDPTFLSVVKDFEAIPVSTLERIKKQRNNGGVSSSSSSPNSGTCQLHLLTVSNPHTYYSKIEKNTQVVPLSALPTNETYVYFPHVKGLVEHDFGESDLKVLIPYINDLGFKACAIAPTFIKKIKGTSNFLSLNEFLNNLNPALIQKDKQYIRFLLIGKNRFDNIHHIVKLIDYKEIKDPVLRAGFHIIQEVSNVIFSKPLSSIAISRSIIEFAKKIDPKLEQDNEILTNFFSHLKKKYPLYENLNGIKFGDKEVIKDFVFYINAKYDG